MTTRSTIVRSLAILCVAALAGCESSQDATVATGLLSGDDARPAAMSPENERSRRRAAEWAEATRGVAFVDGRVQVEPTGRNDPNLGRAQAAHGEQLLRLGHRTLAVGAYVDAIRDAPDLPEAYEGLGWALITHGKLEEAMASYRTALDLEPDRVAARFEVAMLLAREQDFAGAIEEMNGVLELAPDHAEAHERLAIWHYYLDDLDAARGHSARAEALGHAMPPQFKQLID